MIQDTIVLGAGIAGLSAARSLATSGQRVLVLEASARAGGRMFTEKPKNSTDPVELGAEFVHGRPPELLALIAEAGLHLSENTGVNLCYAHGQIGDCGEDAVPWRLLAGMEAAADAYGDMSFDQYLMRQDATPGERQRVRDYVEGFNAADASVISIQSLARQATAEEAIEGDRSAKVVEGYGELAAFVQRSAADAGAEFVFEAPVVRVGWQPGACCVDTADGRRWEAERILCALPLGVLQSGLVRFEPLPAEPFAAIHQLQPGWAARLVLVFSHAWWLPRYAGMRFLFASGHFPRTWWTSAPRDTPVLTAWAGGPQVAAIWDRRSFEQAALAGLREMFGVDVEPMLRSVHFHDWLADPWSRGAYSWAPTGAADAPARIAEPVGRTLFFAGEHTDITGHPGTVHGALRSGLRAADQLLAAARSAR